MLFSSTTSIIFQADPSVSSIAIQIKIPMIAGKISGVRMVAKRKDFF
jgi:hypothetical protein